MILVLKPDTTVKEMESLINKLAWMNLQGIAQEENGRYKIAIVSGADEKTDFTQFALLPDVESIQPFSQKYKLTGRDIKKERTKIDLGKHVIGKDSFTVMAGPCSVESEAQIHQTAKLVAAAGANILRGGAFKPRTSPYDFQGLGEIGLRYLAEAAKQNNLLCVSEVMDTQDIELLARYVDILQIGARNMQNFSLLKQVGKVDKPILLKRGMSATYNDFLMAAEYILQTGNDQVILCERGIRTFETHARNTLDIAAIPILRELSHLPVIIDPSHGTGIRQVVPAMAYASLAAGSDGIMVEVHPEPDKALSDAKQTISTETFADMMDQLKKIASVMQVNISKNILC